MERLRSVSQANLSERRTGQTDARDDEVATTAGDP
jgi:hypothetical protein